MTARLLFGRLMKCEGFRAGLVVVTVLLLANITLVVGRHTGRFDASDFFCPYFMLIADHARHGELLTWTPLVECGCPAGFDPEIGAFSPLTVGMAAILGPHEWAFRAYWLVLWSIAALGMLQLARNWQAPWWAAIGGALAYSFCAVFTNQTEYTAYLTVMAFMPVVLWRLDIALLSGRRLPAMQAGALWGLAALCGYPSLIIIGYCYFAAWSLGRIVAGTLRVPSAALQYAPESQRRWLADGTRSVPATMCLFAIVSLIVLAPAYDGFLRELAGYSDRQQELSRDEAIKADALDPRALSTAANPYLAIVGAYRVYRLWTTDVANSSVYLSPLFVVLGLASVWLRPCDRFRWWLAGLALFCLAAALGGSLPIRGWLYDLLPPMRYFRHAAVFRCHYLFTLVLLALMSARDLQDSDKKFVELQMKRLIQLSIILAIIAVITIVIVFAVVPWDRKDTSSTVVAAAHAIIVWGGTIVLFFVMRRKNAANHRFSAGHYAIALCTIDSVLTVVLSRPVMFTDRDHVWAAVEQQQRKEIDLTGRPLQRQHDFKPSRAAPANACLVAKVPVLRCFNVLHNKFYDSPDAGALLAKLSLGDDRVWFAPEASPGLYNQSTLECLTSRFKASGELDLIISDPDHFATVITNTAISPPTTKLKPLPVRLTRYDSRRMEFNVTCPASGWLLVTDRWASSWHAEVNGRVAKVWIGDLVFRAVQVDGGENHIAFTYLPSALGWWLMASWSLLAGVAGATVYMFCHKKMTILKPEIDSGATQAID